MILALSIGRDASPELRARVALDEDGVRALLRAPRAGIREIVALSTCHRTELYVVTDAPEADAVHGAVGLLPALHSSDQSELQLLRGAEAIEHLFRVACGLDSLVVGEPQVLGQVRRAFNLARGEGAAGPTLSNVFGRAIRLGRDARSSTNLGRVSSTIGSLTAEQLGRHFGDLAGLPGAVVGSGEAATDAARALHEMGARLSVVGRSVAHTRKLALAVGGEPRAIEDIPQVFDASEFAVVAVGGGVLVRRAQVLPRARPLVLFDISVPRSVDIAGRADVDLRTIDDLAPEEGAEMRAAIDDAEEMVMRAVAEWERWLDAQPAGRDIAQFRAHAEVLVEREIAAVIAGMELTPRDAERIAALGHRIARKLLHGATVAMREGDDDMRALIRKMFDLEP